MNTTTLLTGGSRSGKSRYALTLASGYARKGFVATAREIDDETKERIIAHRKERDKSFITHEEPHDIDSAVMSLSKQVDVVLIDCLTVWLGNLMHKYNDCRDTCPEYDAFLEMLKKPPCDLIIVTNEVGTGIVPANALARRFRDTSGILNQEVAALADTVALFVCGIPVILKGKLHE